MKGVGFVSEYDGIPKLSTIDWSGRVHPGVLTRVGGSGSLTDAASSAFLGSEGSPVHGGPSLAPRAVVIFLASSWKAAGNNARKVWFFSDVFVIAKIRLP